MINAANPSKKKTKVEAQKEAKKNNATALKFLLDGLPSTIRDSLGEFTLAKELWLKLEEDYQGKAQGKQLEDEQETEPDPIYDEVDKALADDEKKLMNDSEDAENELEKIIIKESKRIYTGFSNVTEIKIREPDLTPIKNHVVDSLHKLQQRIKEVKDLLRN